MAVILEERGRGKFKPAPDYDVDEVKALLNQKIEEERMAFADCSEQIEFDQLKYDTNKWNLLSLFSGCGGLDLGFELAGLKAVMGETVMEKAFADKEVFDANIENNVFNTIYVNDIFDEARETYAQNAGRYIYMDKSDIRKIKEFPKADIVLGGFPCPGFSEAGPRLVDDKRNFLYLHFIRCLMQSKPKIFVAENVKGMMTLGKGEVFKQIVQDFSAAGYTIYHKMLNSAEYGVPQGRERVIFFGFKKEALTVKALQELSKKSISEEYDPYPIRTHYLGENTKNTNLKPFVNVKQAFVELSEPEFSDDLSQQKYSKAKFMGKHCQGQQEVKLNGVGPTIRSEHHGNIEFRRLSQENGGVYSDELKKGMKERRLTIRECARIQTFPDDYEFIIPKIGDNTSVSASEAYKIIGNAVPPLLAFHIAKRIEDNWNKYFGG